MSTDRVTAARGIGWLTWGLFGIVLALLALAVVVPRSGVSFVFYLVAEALRGRPYEGVGLVFIPIIGLFLVWSASALLALAAFLRVAPSDRFRARVAFAAAFSSLWLGAFVAAYLVALARLMSALEGPLDPR